MFLSNVLVRKVLKQCCSFKLLSQVLRSVIFAFTMLNVVYV